jgi:hypothetical protein
MKLTTMAAAVGALAFVVAATTAHAVVVTGGNGKADCYAGLDVAADGPILKQTPAAITAGACERKCTFTVKSCVGLSEPTKCTATALSSLTSSNSAVANPPTLGPENACGPEGTVSVSLPSGKKKVAKTKIKLIGTAQSAKPKKDTDNIKLICKENGEQGCGTTGGTACPTDCNNAAGGPNRLELKIATTGTDLDNGWKGNSHNFPLVPNGVLSLCLSECDGNTDTTCTACGKIGAGTRNGEIFGAPLPLLTQGTAVCVVSRWRDDIRGTVDEATGDTNLKVLLNSEVYLTDQNNICPQCKNGSCNGGPNNGKSCTVEATLPVFISANRTDQYQLSSTCVPSQPVATLQIDFDPLTSGTSGALNGPTPCPAGPGQIQPKATDCPGDTCAEGNCTGNACVTKADDPTNPGQQVCIDSKGGISQACCVNKTTQPCFVRDASGNLTRTGKANPPTPPLPDQTYPKSLTGVLASTFCIPATGTSTIDSVTGLPGPGTILLNGTGEWSK